MASKLAVRVTVKGRVQVLDLNTVDSELETLQSAVGGWIQVVDLKQGMSMYLNEEGKILGLPKNRIATSYFDDTYGEGEDIIVGDVVFTGLPDREGETTGVTSAQLQDIIDRVGG